MAKKGAKLKKLQEFKKGAKMGKKKKCACGCDLVSKKESGGAIIDTCACCGKVHKHQKGGIMKFQNPSRNNAGGVPTQSPNQKGNIQLLNLLKQGKGSLGALQQNIVHNPVIAPISEEGLASMQSRKVPTTVAANCKGGLIKKAQKGTKTKEKYIGNNETWDPKNVGTGDNSMNPKD